MGGYNAAGASDTCGWRKMLGKNNTQVVCLHNDVRKRCCETLFEEIKVINKKSDLFEIQIYQIIESILFH